ncbi:MAG: N-acetylmuramoyl-L-alanine amidase [Deltaproteobacteria bacterium]|nr:N-acetylmuramoyl-L-alanine amidase [Deltaproteobacteria bacterium]
MPVDLVVLHYTGMPATEAALARLCDPASGVSAHYLIDEAGAVYRLVAESRRAWHAGIASWAGEADVNGRSIGIELANPGHEFGYVPFPEAQLDALERLLGDIRERRRIDPVRVVGHSDVAPLRKRDPGELFPWRRLAAKGLAYWPGGGEDSAEPDTERARVALTRIGYGFCEDVEGLAAVLAAFQRRFRPSCCDGRLDPETMARIGAVAHDLD